MEWKSALEVAKYLLLLADNNQGDTLSNLKMQKLLYYAQGYSLALFDTPIFQDRIEAWEYGPVVKNVYNAFKKYGKESISFNELENFSTDEIAKHQEHQDLLVFIFKKYGSYGAWKLADKTHNEPPYKEHFKINLNNEIPKEALAKFFKVELQKKGML